MGIVEEVASEITPPKRVKPSNEMVKDALHKASVVTGTFAKTLAPKVKKKEKSITDEIAEELAAQKKGYVPNIPEAFIDPNEARAVESVTSSIVDEVKIEASGKVIVGPTGNSKGDRLLARFGPAARNVLTALSLDEHFIVGNLYKATGMDKKSFDRDLHDYTWTNFIRDYKFMGEPLNKKIGLRDDWTTEAAGTGLSILLSPATYLTFGISPAAKIGLKTGLTGKGVRAVAKLAKEEGNKIVALEAAKKPGKILTKAEENVLRQRVKQEIEDQLAKRFGDINATNKDLKISEGVEALPKSVVSKGGAKLEVPFARTEIPLIPRRALEKTKEIYQSAEISIKGKKVIDGIEVAKTIEESGLPKFIKITAAATKEKLDPLKKGTQTVMKAFNKNYGVDENLLRLMRRSGADAEKLLNDPTLKGISRQKVEISYMTAEWERYEQMASRISRTNQERVAKAFKGMSNKQQEEFMDTLIKFSVKSNEELKTAVKAGEEAKFALRSIRGRLVPEITSKDPIVNKALDRWLGRGKHQGKGLMEAFGRKADLIESEGLPIWVPGIIGRKVPGLLGKDVAIAVQESTPSLRLPSKPPLEKSSREFLKSRVSPKLAKKYTRDPVTAIGYRLTEIAYANLQDKFFDNIVAKGLGGLKRAKSAEEAARFIRQGMVQLRSPLNDYALYLGRNLKDREKEITYFIDKDFYKAYRENTRETEFVIPLITPYTRIWKQNVTSAFPQFHARNFNSNVLLNALRIGGHAIEPRKFLFAMEAVLKRKMDAKTLPFTTGIVKRTLGGAAGGFVYGSATGGEEGSKKGAVAGAAAAFGLSDGTYKALVHLIFGKGMERTVRTQIGEKIVLKNFIKEAEEIGLAKKGFFQADIGGYGMDKTISEIWSSNLWNYANPLSREFVPSVFGKKFGEAIETQAKLVNYVTWRMKGLSPKAAAWEANEALFDYNNITGFEKTLNNTIFPFYTFSKKNLENAYKLFAHRPASIVNQLKFMRDMGPSEQEFEDLPRWAKNRFIVNFRGNLISGFGVPLEDILELSGGLGREGPEGIGQNLLLRLNPLLRYAAEKTIIGKDIFSNRELKDVNHANEFLPIIQLMENPKVPKFIKKSIQPIQEWLRLERDLNHPEKIKGDPDKIHFLRSMFTSRYQSTLGQLSKEDKGPMEKTIRFLFGFVKLEKDPDLQASIRRRETLDKMEEFFAKTNYAKKIKMPKNFPYFIGEDKLTSKMANSFINELQNAETQKEFDEILEEAKQEAEQEQLDRIKFNIGE